MIPPTRRGGGGDRETSLAGWPEELDLESPRPSRWYGAPFGTVLGTSGDRQPLTPAAAARRYAFN